MLDEGHSIQIREAVQDDFLFVVDLMETALMPFYGGDHTAHARRIFDTHISGGTDHIGHFSLEQRMFIVTVDGCRAGMLHLVGKRQYTYKISPIIVHQEFRGKKGIGNHLLNFAERYCRERNARQIYCTVAQPNRSAVNFFIKNGYVIAGNSDSHYMINVTELMLYKLFTTKEYEDRFDRPHISILPMERNHEQQVRELLVQRLPNTFYGIDDKWVSALFEGYKRRSTRDINLKYKLIFVALDRDERVLGVAAATPKKGLPIKIMPFIATNNPAFVALLTDIPYEIKQYGHKLYMHISPSVDEVLALQQRGWRLDAAMPGAYHDDRVTQQWSLDISGDNIMRTMRVKQIFLNEIRIGRKKIEVRVGYEGIKNIKHGEKIKLASRTDELIIRVVAVRSYSNFDEMMNTENYREIAPQISDRDEVLKLLREIYPPFKEALGVYVLQVEPDVKG